MVVDLQPLINEGWRHAARARRWRYICIGLRLFNYTAAVVVAARAVLHVLQGITEHEMHHMWTSVALAGATALHLWFYKSARDGVAHWRELEIAFTKRTLLLMETQQELQRDNTA